MDPLRDERRPRPQPLRQGAGQRKPKASHHRPGSGRHPGRRTECMASLLVVSDTVSVATRRLFSCKFFLQIRFYNFFTKIFLYDIE